MNAFKVNSSFVSERINKIRLIDYGNSLEEPDFVITGSSGFLKLWKLETVDEIESDCTPKAISKLAVGDVTALEVVDHKNIIAASGSGYSLCRLERDNLRENYRFDKLHTFKTGDKALCTGLSFFDDNVASIGEGMEKPWEKLNDEHA